MIMAPRRLPDRDRRTGERDDSEHDVDEHRPAPAQVLRQQPTEHQSDRGTTPGDRPPDPERLSPLSRRGEHHGHQRQRRRRQHRPEAPLQSPRTEQHRGVSRSTTQRGGQSEPDDPDLERPLTPQPIRQPPPEQQQGTERQRIRSDHPLPIRIRETQITLRRRQRNVHHGAIKHHHELRKPNKSQRPPSTRIHKRRSSIGRGHGEAHLSQQRQENIRMTTTREDHEGPPRGISQRHHKHRERPAPQPPIRAFPNPRHMARPRNTNTRTTFPNTKRPRTTIVGDGPIDELCDSRGGLSQLSQDIVPDQRGRGEQSPIRVGDTDLAAPHEHDPPAMPPAMPNARLPPTEVRGQNSGVPIGNRFLLPIRARLSRRPGPPPRRYRSFGFSWIRRLESCLGSRTIHGIPRGAWGVGQGGHGVEASWLAAVGVGAGGCRAGSCCGELWGGGGACAFGAWGRQGWWRRWCGFGRLVADDAGPVAAGC